jgi:hypothetical protein
VAKKSHRRVRSPLGQGVRRVVVKVQGLARGAKRLRYALALIEGSALFDRDWYLESYPEVATSGLDPLRHYLKIGWLEGRDPSPDFSTFDYLARNDDVARSGINPLAHYIEFGRAEGRGTADHRAVPDNEGPKSFGFAEPAPVISFPVAEKPTPIWRRWNELDPASPALLTLAERPVAFAAGDRRAGFRSACQVFEWLSGFGEPTGDVALALKDLAQEPLDSWHVNASILRTRWHVEGEPLVMRAFQCDPRAAGRIDMVAEAVLSTESALADLRLRNPLFPVLFLFAEPEGELRGTSILAFPSLCRGGIHYPELVTEGGASPFRHGNRQAAEMLDLVVNGEPAVERLLVDVSGADGRAPLFQPDFQDWARLVARVGLEARFSAAASVGERYLQAAFPNTQPRRSGGATLELGHDMVPTIASLVTKRANERGGTPDARAMIIAGLSSSEQVIKIALPVGHHGSTRQRHPASKWPHISRDDERRSLFAIPLAIRDRYRPHSPAELVTPLTPATLPMAMERCEAITWIVDAATRTPAQFQQCLRALAHQDDATEDCLRIIGQRPGDHAEQVLFEGRIGTAQDARSALESVTTPLVGYVGPSVLFHDRGTASLLASLLSDGSVATVGCVLIAIENQTHSPSVTVADPGSFLDLVGDPLDLKDGAQVAQQLWRSTYSVSRPSRHLWLTRADRTRLRAPKEEIHLCTSLITATVGAGSKEPVLNWGEAEAATVSRAGMFFA